MDARALHEPALAAAYQRVALERNLDDDPDSLEASNEATDPDEQSSAFWHAQHVPDLEWLLRRAAAACLLELEGAGWPREHAFGVLFTGDTAMAELNGRWRGRAAPTNVLSWPGSDLRPGDVPPPHWGDLAFAYGTIEREAGERGWDFQAYLAHLTVHGLLHCLGYDHETSDDDAEAMERLEARILTRLGLPDPYSDTQPQ